MSSNQMNPENNTQTKNIRSIRRRLAGGRVWRKIGVSLSKDILFLFTALLVWLAAAEYNASGRIDLFHTAREFTLDSAATDDTFHSFFSILDHISYTVTEIETGEILVNSHPFIYARDILFVALLIMIAQVILHVLSYPLESGRIKKILKPLDEIAEKADKLASYDFSEEKYHIIEDKIDSVKPWEDELISLGDEDLMGIERAMNSLIKRTWENNERQTRFVNDASHELRTPIAVIQGYVNMLARWGREDEKVLDESITAIQNESENMKHLVEQLLFLARSDSGRTKLEPANVDLNALMSEVYEESLMIDEDHIYKFNDCSERISAFVDEGMLKQALRILLDNASKYTEKGEEIILSLGPSGEGQAFLRVQDNGIGMKEKDVKNMFDRFYRADEARRYDGTGLGLSIAKWIIDRHGGHFEIVSRENLGTRIDIVIPVQ